MSDVIAYVTLHWVDITAIVGGIVTVASIIVKLTPTLADDAALAKVIKVLEVLSLNKPKV